MTDSKNENKAYRVTAEDKAIAQIIADFFRRKEEINIVKFGTLNYDPLTKKYQVIEIK